METLKDNRPLFTLTVSEFAELWRSLSETHVPANKVTSEFNDDFAYGIMGLAGLVGCSRATAQSLKNSGIFNDAISQIGRKIVIDKAKTLEILRARNMKFNSNHLNLKNDGRHIKERKGNPIGSNASY